MATSITDVLNIWNDMGVFSYVLPFLLIFAVVFAILKKTKILSGSNPQDENDGILAIVSVALGLLALQNDMVSIFFMNIFPKFGVGIAVFLVLIIMLGFFWPDRKADAGLKGSWIGYVVGIGVVLWAFNSWNQWGGYSFGGWFNENFWAIVVLGVIVGSIIAIVKGGKKPGDK
jgi:hypothetical protein